MEICRDHQRGYCKRGLVCPFHHGQTVASPSSVKVKHLPLLPPPLSSLHPSTPLFLSSSSPLSICNISFPFPHTFWQRGRERDDDDDLDDRRSSSTSTSRYSGVDVRSLIEESIIYSKRRRGEERRGRREREGEGEKGRERGREEKMKGGERMTRIYLTAVDKRLRARLAGY